jgi:hypothetical protein
MSPCYWSCPPDKAKPVARRGRKATGLYKNEMAGLLKRNPVFLPKSSEKTEYSKLILVVGFSDVRPFLIQNNVGNECLKP